MNNYLKSKIWDLILGVFISLGLAIHALAGFLLADKISSSILAIGLILIIVFCIFILFSYKKQTLFIGIVLGVISAISFIFYARKNNPFDDETANSLCITLLVIMITAIVVYFLMQSRIGIIVLFLMGNLIMAGSYFLEFPVKVWSFLLVEFSIFILYWYRNHKITKQLVHTGKVASFKFMTQAMIICLLSFLVSGGIFFFVIRPLDLPTKELKLIINHQSMQMLEVLGVYSNEELLDPNKTSNQNSDDLTYSNEAGDKKNENKEAKESENNAEGTQNAQQETKSEVNPSNQAAQAIHYSLEHLQIPWMIIFIVFLIFLLFIFQYYRRRQFRKRLHLLGKETVVVNYYLYFLRKLEIAGYQRPGGYTLLEYAKTMDHELERFSDEEKIFTRLTEIYNETFYGNHKVSEEEYQLFETFYEGFLKNLHKEVGFFHYIFNQRNILKKK